MTLKFTLEKLMRGKDLNELDCKQAIDEMLSPSRNDLQAAAFLVLLRTKSETPDELYFIIDTLKKRMIEIQTPYKVLDIVGTGGDGLNTINISTGSAILTCACGVKVAKHGNRSVSSLAGSADVLEALGVNIQQTPEQISRSIDQIGIGFCYSPNFHPVMQSLKSLRKNLNVSTTFNILGPLMNPMNAAHTVLGVHDERFQPILADVLIKLGTSRSVIVHGTGLDEISCVGSTKIIEITQKEKIEYEINPLEFCLESCTVADLQGGDAKLNAQLLISGLKGEHKPIANTLILNAAVALYIYGLYSSIREAVFHARENLYNGSALRVLTNWIDFSHEP